MIQFVIGPSGQNPPAPVPAKKRNLYLPDGNPEWQVRMINDMIKASCHEYEGWKEDWPRARICPDPVVDYSNPKPWHHAHALIFALDIRRPSPAWRSHPPPSALRPAKPGFPIGCCTILATGRAGRRSPASMASRANRSGLAIASRGVRAAAAMADDDDIPPLPTESKVAMGAAGPYTGRV